jgi:hydroxymethylpyrimidine/phosphomethylpyrimidine kinase
VSLLKKSYFVRSKCELDGKVVNTNWTVVSIYRWEEIVYWVNNYRHNQENTHGGGCMITELRRL